MIMNKHSIYGCLLISTLSGQNLYAQPDIGIQLNQNQFVLGQEAITVSISGKNTDTAVKADLHIGLFSPSGKFYALPDWNPTFKPWMSAIILPADFDYPNTPVMVVNPQQVELSAGEWIAISALTEPNSLDVISISQVKFIINQADVTDNATVTTDANNLLTDPSIQLRLNLPDSLYQYANVSLPEYFLIPPTSARHMGGMMNMGNNDMAVIDYDNTPANNPITDAGATLGRVLFYDKQLSKNDTIACASCHIQSEGFSDSAVLSKGFAGGLTGRHSMGLSNARFSKRGRFFWDERAATLEEQVLMPIQDAVEMGLTLEELVSKVSAQAYYAPLFTLAFGDDEITTDRISKALAQFVRSLLSIDSKYDHGRAQVKHRDDDFPNFTVEENLGKALFNNPQPLGGGFCAHCHNTEAFIDASDTVATNNGLDADTSTDQGIFKTTENVNDQGKFRVPSLRNIAVTAPYMHDGRFADLEAVIEHYNSGIQAHPNLSFPLNFAGNPIRMNFSEEDKAHLIAFLNTLTDDTLLHAKKFSNPFITP